MSLTAKELCDISTDITTHSKNSKYHKYVVFSTNTIEYFNTLTTRTAGILNSKSQKHNDGANKKISADAAEDDLRAAKTIELSLTNKELSAAAHADKDQHLHKLVTAGIKILHIISTSPAAGKDCDPVIPILTRINIEISEKSLDKLQSCMYLSSRSLQTLIFVTSLQYSFHLVKFFPINRIRQYFLPSINAHYLHSILAFTLSTAIFTTFYLMRIKPYNDKIKIVNITEQDIEELESEAKQLKQQEIIEELQTLTQHNTQQITELEGDIKTIPQYSELVAAKNYNHFSPNKAQNHNKNTSLPVMQQDKLKQYYGLAPKAYYSREIVNHLHDMIDTMIQQIQTLQKENADKYHYSYRYNNLSDKLEDITLKLITDSSPQQTLISLNRMLKEICDIDISQIIEPDSRYNDKQLSPLRKTLNKNKQCDASDLKSMLTSLKTAVSDKSEKHLHLLSLISKKEYIALMSSSTFITSYNIINAITCYKYGSVQTPYRSLAAAACIALIVFSVATCSVHESSRVLRYKPEELSTMHNID